MRLNREFIKSIIPQADFLGIELPEDVIFSIDSRSLNAREIFVALQGVYVDGHAYVQDAIKKGAAGLMVHNTDCLKAIPENAKKKITIIIVPNTSEAIVALARAWRSQFSYPVIGVTGSVGKTTTKEMIASIVRLAGKTCLCSEGNQNTLLGASLNILKMRESHNVAVFELGINKRGEMARLAEMIRPTTAVITAVGHSHMEGLGSIQDIAAEKRDIFKYFKDDNIGIINGDYSIFSSISYAHPVIRFGSKMTNQIQARKVQNHGANTHFVLRLYKNRYKITMPTNHMGPIMSGLAATAVAYVLNIREEIIVQALQNPPSVKSRFEHKALKNKKGLLIDDCYNASPESMKAALLAFERIDANGKKIAVIGDMLELGVNAPFWHRQVGRFLRKVPSINHVIFVGENVKWSQKTVPVYVSSEIVPDWQAALTVLNLQLKEQAVVLVKGSNGIGLKNLVQEIAE